MQMFGKTHSFFMLCTFEIDWLITILDPTAKSQAQW